MRRELVVAFPCRSAIGCRKGKLRQRSSENNVFFVPVRASRESGANFSWDLLLHTARSKIRCRRVHLTFVFFGAKANLDGVAGARKKVV